MQAVVSELLALFAEVVPRLARITLFIAVGVYVANLAVAFGLVRYVAGLAGYLTRPANLPDEVGTAILTTAASTTAGYATLAEYRESGLLDDRATLVAVVINTFFGFVQHVFTYYVPVLIPILGWTTGVMYVSARAGVALAITVTGVLAGGVLLSERNVDRSALADLEGTTDGKRTTDGERTEEGTTDGERTDAANPGPDGAEPGAGTGAGADTRTGWERARDAATKSSGTLRRIVPRLAVIYTLVVALIRYVDVASATAFAEPLTAAIGLPGAAVPVIAIYTLDTTAGAVTIAPLIGETFTPRQAVATLLVGSIVSFAVSTFKRSIPFQFGIWGAEFGLKVVVVNTVLKVVFISVAVAFVLMSGP